MLSSESVVSRTGLDEVALKPREVDLASLTVLPFERVTLDYEGRAAVPGSSTIDRLTDLASVRMTVPVRADGFDPLGDDRWWDRLTDGTDVALVAGNPTYLSAEERRRGIAPRLAAALERAPEGWVGTEGIESVALATRATQFELLAPDTERRVRALRTVGFDGGIAVYAPVVLSADEDALLDALGPYVARRRPVAASLPADTPSGPPVSGRARQVLLGACRDYAMVGGIDAVGDRVAALRTAGVDHVVGYPARGLEEFADDG